MPLIVCNTVDEGLAWAKSSAASTHNGKSWDGWCLSAANRFVGGNGGWDYASDAADAAKIISTDPHAAPAGCTHYWRHVPALIHKGGNGQPGHVAPALGGGRGFMASTWVDSHGKAYHRSLGSVDVAAYSAAHPGMRYVGWSYDLGGRYVMQGVIVVVKVPGHSELYRIGTDLTRHHLTPAEWKPLKARGVVPKSITAARLDAFRAA